MYILFCMVVKKISTNVRVFCVSRSRQSWSAICVRNCRYETLVQQDGYMHQINNPEVEVNVNEANYIIEQQKIQLKIITGKLNNAFKGEEVTWVKTGTLLFLCGMFKYGRVECLLLSQSDNDQCCTGTNFGLGGQLYTRYNVRLPLDHSGSDSCTNIIVGSWHVGIQKQRNKKNVIGWK